MMIMAITTMIIISSDGPYIEEPWLWGDILRVYWFLQLPYRESLNPKP